MGFVTGVRGFEAVGRFTHLAGPGDSTLVLFGVSLPNRALQFRRADPGYIASYRVAVTFRRGSDEVTHLSEVEEVRVATFRETGRTDESVIFQARQPLPPGSYRVEVELRDLESGHGFEDELDLVVPALGPQAQRLGDPVLVYRIERRPSAEEPPSLILNPRATVPFGTGSLTVYVEGYGEGDAVVLDVVDSKEEVLWRDTAWLRTEGPVRYAVVSIVADRLPVGALRIRAHVSDGPTTSTPILIGLSPRWLLSSYEQILDLLRYAATAAELDSLRHAPAEERGARWRAFWRSKDPIPATPEHEFFDQYFTRVHEANRLFSEPQRPGWRSERGEVYIVLGSPEQVFSSTQVGPGARVRWVYDRRLGYELRLDFIDRTGFGSYELTPDSRARFRDAAARLRRR